jgi:pimeloyl-ACP methyl ester carboxylesterase
MPIAKLAAVSMWYDERGQGDLLVVLHPGGAGVDSRALAPNLEALSRLFRTYAPEQRAHGHTPDRDGPISYDVMARDTIAFIDLVVGRPVHLLGCSDGAVVALHRPDLVHRLVLAAGVFHHDGRRRPRRRGAGVPPPKLRASLSGPSRSLRRCRGQAGGHARARARLTPADLRQVTCRTLVMIGDDDQVRLEHAAEMYRSLPRGEFAVVPGTSHGLPVEKPDLCNLLITDFLTKDPAQTFAPIRRAVSPAPG